MENRYMYTTNLDTQEFNVWDEEKHECIATCGKRWDAEHICMVLNGFNAMIAAVKQ